jgi:hypothetical protein
MFEVNAGLCRDVRKLDSDLMDAEVGLRLEKVMVLQRASVCCAVMVLRVFTGRQDRLKQ